MHSISRGSFYYHKREDLKKNINWDLMLLDSHRDKESIKDKEAIFISTLISSFEKFIKKSQDDSNPAIIEQLHKYATTYWRLKAPKNDEFSLSSKLTQTAKATIEQIASIALEENNKLVVDFLSQNAERIINKVFKAK